MDHCASVEIGNRANCPQDLFHLRPRTQAPSGWKGILGPLHSAMQGDIHISHPCLQVCLPPAKQGAENHACGGCVPQVITLGHLRDKGSLELILKVNVSTKTKPCELRWRHFVIPGRKASETAAQTAS